MDSRDIDLYRELNRERPENAKGTLRCYLLDKLSEVCKERLYPAILIIPGGAYQWVSPREAEPVALRYLAKGFAVFVLEYSTAPSTFPTAFLEAAMAMLYIRDNAQSLSVNAQKVAALGFSAGGHLCGCLAMLFHDDVICTAFSGRNQDVRPDAVILSYPVVTSGTSAHTGSFDSLCGGDEQLKNRLSLERCVSKSSSPAFIWHTFSDQAVPVKNSLLLAAAYEEAGVPFSLHIFEKGSHGLSTADWGAYATGNQPDISTGLNGWIDMSIDWLRDRQIVIDDK